MHKVLTHRIIAWYSLVSDEHKPDAANEVQIWAADIAITTEDMHSVELAGDCHACSSLET